jgi:DNA polymerase elongation subunit (family B)
MGAGRLFEAKDSASYLKRSLFWRSDPLSSNGEFMELRGRLFDLYPLESSMILWIKKEDGRLWRFEDPFRPRFYAQGKQSDLFNLFNALQKKRQATGYQWTRKRELWSGDEVEVMEIEVVDSEAYAQLTRILPPWEEKMTFYNCDIPLPQTYLYERKIFPTGRCVVEAEGNRIFEVHPDPSESVWMNDGEIPDLRIMELHTLNQNAPGQVLILECEGYRLEMEEIDVGEIGRFLKQFDPDVILSEDGDASLLPLLFLAERRWETFIPWDREPYPLKRQVHPKGRSYFSYGRTYYRAPAHLFLGRWHIDRRNSFLYGESGMEGVIELARLAKIPVQRMARTSPGTAITSMQLDRAFQEGILVPWRKGEPERFKTAWDLLVADKGGLVFQPKLGIFEDVAEIDFASMYPTIMAIHNISPETNDYKVDSLTALAAQQLEDVGIKIHPGEKVRYVIKDALSKDKSERVRPFPLLGPDDTYDVKKYMELLVKATEEVLIHVGYDVRRLKKMIDTSFPLSLGDYPQVISSPLVGED